MKLSLAPTSGGEVLDAIAFNITGQWPETRVGRVDILYRLDVNCWRGRESPQVLIQRMLAAD